MKILSLLLAATNLTATPTTLRSVWVSAHSGDTITLAPGTYSFGVWYPTDMSYSVPLVIDANQATLVGFHAVRLTNVAFNNGHYVAGEGRPHAFHCYQCKRVSTSGLNLHSDNTAGGNGIYFDQGSNVEAIGTISTGFLNAIVIDRVNGFRVSGGDFSGMGSDGVDIANSQNGVVEDVSVHDNKLRGASHPDGVQLWSSRGRAKTANVTVRRTKVVGFNMQGIDAFNHPRQGQIGFENINFEDNIVQVGWSVNGVALYNSVGGGIRRNRISTYPGAASQTRIKTAGNTNVVCEGNTVAAYGSQPAIND